MDQAEYSRYMDEFLFDDAFFESLDDDAAAVTVQIVPDKADLVQDPVKPSLVEQLFPPGEIFGMLKSTLIYYG